MILSGVKFDSGKVRTTISLSSDKDSGRILLGYSPRTSRYLTVGLGGGEGEAYDLSEFAPGIGWLRLAGSGQSSDLEIDRPYRVEVETGRSKNKAPSGRDQGDRSHFEGAAKPGTGRSFCMGNRSSGLRFSRNLSPCPFGFRRHAIHGTIQRALRRCNPTGLHRIGCRSLPGFRYLSAQALSCKTSSKG